MERLVLGNGLKSFEIADEEGNVRGIISFNPADFGFISRAKTVEKDIKEYIDSIPEGEDEELLEKMDKIARAKMDELFGTKVSDVVFGNVNCMSYSNGEPLIKKALDTLVPVVSKYIAEELESGAKNIDKYTKDVVR